MIKCALYCPNTQIAPREACIKHPSKKNSVFCRILQNGCHIADPFYLKTLRAPLTSIRLCLITDTIVSPRIAIGIFWTVKACPVDGRILMRRTETLRGGDRPELERC